MVKSLPILQETQVQSLGQEDPLEKEMATHFSILAGEGPKPHPHDSTLGAEPRPRGCSGLGEPRPALPSF